MFIIIFYITWQKSKELGRIYKKLNNALIALDSAEKRYESAQEATEEAKAEKDKINSEILQLSEYKHELNIKKVQEFAQLDNDIQNKINKNEELLEQKKQDFLNEFNEFVINKNLEKEELNNKLDLIKRGLDAADEAARRKKIIESKPEDFSINLSAADKADIKKLMAFKEELNNERILLMLIWTSYIKSPLDMLCNKLFGQEDVCGIYKITNLLTKESYIGQSVNIRTRFQQHCKRGLGIDCPANNKFYNNLQEYGVWNFSFEVIEKCKREELDERERFYIDLYNTSTSLNSTSGNN